ncbi:MAG: serine/threonine-protein kinase [Myxococcota bacterium]
MLPPPTALPDWVPRLAEGRYVLLSRLGEGGMAGVYAAWDVEHDEWRAIKVLFPKHARNRGLSQRFENEGRTMMTLQSPHLVRVLEVGRQDDLPYLVMELVHAGSLYGWREHHGPMPARMAVEATMQLCRGLAVVHEADIVHRDVKPRNVLINWDGGIKLTDFGIARFAASGETRTGLAMGTLGYMSPEQLHDAKSVDARSDLYAVGATLWTMITARKPKDLFRLDDRADRMQGVPEPLHDVLRTCLAYERDQRYASAQDVVDILDGRLADLPEDPPDAPPLPLEIEPPEITSNPEATFREILEHVERTPTPTIHPSDPPVPKDSKKAPVLPLSFPSRSDLPRPDESLPPAHERLRARDDSIPAYLVGVEQAPARLGPETITGRDDDASSVGRRERTSGRVAAAVALVVATPVALGLLVLIAGFAFVLSAGVRIAAAGDAIDTAAGTLASRVVEASPLIEELAGLGLDSSPLEAAMGTIESEPDPRAKAMAALSFVDEASRLARTVSESDRHEARLVRQRLDRVRVARDAFVQTWMDCEAICAGFAGRWALALEVTTPTCEREGEP